eukprot:gb/GFBE01065673.1/.p1 GENE.gb/GFBE01065673.1/~~gb/GFBE01065673.1/.p1  ORF type:complete len:117 (+),score=19.71 gb/GFBE01065673.1/:1-351(+)
MQQRGRTTTRYEAAGSTPSQFPASELQQPYFPCYNSGFDFDGSTEDGSQSLNSEDHESKQARLVFMESERGLPSLHRGWRTPDPSPTRADLPKCAAYKEQILTSPDSSPAIFTQKS